LLFRNVGATLVANQSLAGASSYESLLQFSGVRVSEISVGARPTGRTPILKC
jgi:hypothetical protein